MHETEGGTPKPSGQELPGTASGEDRFDGESARRILQRAAAEQQRLSNELADSYSFEELEEMAAEAGISAEALRAAVEAHRHKSATAASGMPFPEDERPRRRRSAAKTLMPRSWSVKGAVLATAGGIGFVGLLLAFPAFAEIVFLVLLSFLILLAVLILLGASPF
jgi:hypothetical protein